MAQLGNGGFWSHPWHACSPSTTGGSSWGGFVYAVLNSPCLESKGISCAGKKEGAGRPEVLLPQGEPRHQVLWRGAERKDRMRTEIARPPINQQGRALRARLLHGPSPDAVPMSWPRPRLHPGAMAESGGAMPSEGPGGQTPQAPVPRQRATRKIISRQ